MSRVRRFVEGEKRTIRGGFGWRQSRNREGQEDRTAGSAGGPPVPVIVRTTSVFSPVSLPLSAYQPASHCREMAETVSMCLLTFGLLSSTDDSRRMGERRRCALCTHSHTRSLFSPNVRYSTPHEALQTTGSWTTIRQMRATQTRVSGLCSHSEKKGAFASNRQTS